jgi:hypothetical protein
MYNILNLEICLGFIVTSSSYDSNAGIINGEPTGRCLKLCGLCLAYLVSELPYT